MIRFQEVSYTYLSQEPGKEQSPSLDHISFHIPKGQCVVLCGKSGCGKTTLLRIVNGLACHFYRGRLEGDVSVSGMAPASASLPELARVVGSVFQNPRTQFFHTDTTGELAFQLENQNMPREQMRRCLDQVVSELRLEALMDRSIFALSGGEKQQIACGSVYASMPRVVVLDEPSSNLDLESIRKLQGLLETMKASGVTILVSEHRLWYLHGLADRYLLLENGKLRGDLAPVQMTALDSQARQAIGLRAANRRQLFSLCPQAQLVEQREPGLELHKFYYDGAQTPALNHVSFTVEPGQTVAFVGPSGGGKTTAASLIPRFWDVSSGTVLVGGVDVRDIDPHVLMDQIAFVFQNSRLFKASILENVRAAKPNASREEVLAALAAAQCGDILEKLPQGMDTMIGTEGTYLSGGEQQRIALARAILKDAPIVVLDEATAFADPENEALIQKAFAKLTKDRTVIMIAHRLSTVVGADQILALDKGEVLERGTHEELTAAGGLYARMWADYTQAIKWKIASGS